MTAYYVASTGSNTSPYDTWAKAATSFGAVVPLATGDGDVIYVDQGFTETLSAATTYTFANNVAVICSNDTTNEPPQTLGIMGDSNWIGASSSSSYSITLAGAYKVYLYGMTFRTAGTSTVNITIGSTDGAHFEIENCYLWNGNTGTPSVQFGSPGSSVNGFVLLRNCTIRSAKTTHSVTCNCVIVIDGGSYVVDVVPTEVFKATSRGAYVTISGFDFSAITTTLVASQSGAPAIYVFDNCKRASGVNVLATQSPANKGSAQVWMYNCSDSDQHYQFSHHDAFGSTLVETGIYANDGAQYDGTNYCSWKITSTENCSYYTPYVSQWIDCYHSGTSAITPYLEILRDGSTTAYQDDEVWVEFSYQGTSGYPLATIVSDRKGLLASAANQDAGVGTSGWTGDTDAWSGKLQSPSITPAEIGHLRARVCVGEPSITVYVDPQIRGRS